MILSFDPTTTTSLAYFVIHRISSLPSPQYSS